MSAEAACDQPSGCARLRYLLGAEHTPSRAVDLTPWQLALVGKARSRAPLCAINTIAAPYTFTFNGSDDTTALAGCDSPDSTCCPDVRDIWMLCAISGVPAGTSFLVAAGDAKPPAWWPPALPVLCGNRLIGGPGIVVPTSSERWYGHVSIYERRSTIPWASKRPQLFWRGVRSSVGIGLEAHRMA